MIFSSYLSSIRLLELAQYSIKESAAEVSQGLVPPPLLISRYEIMEQ
jgi:hypothetical protein